MINYFWLSISIIFFIMAISLIYKIILIIKIKREG